MPILAHYTGQQVERARWLQAEIHATTLELFSPDPLDVADAKEWIQTCATQLAALHSAATLAANDRP